MKTFALLLTFLSTQVMGLEPPTQTEMDFGPFGPFPNFAPVKREIVCERKPGTDYITCEYVPQNVKLPGLSISDAETIEGDYGTKLLKFDVSLTSPSATGVKVKFGTIDNTAQESQDYESTSGVVVFPPGSVNQEIHVTIYGDTLYADDDGTETFFVNLHSIRGAKLIKDQAVGTILNDDFSILDARSDLSEQMKQEVSDRRDSEPMYGRTIIDLDNDNDDDVLQWFARDFVNSDEFGFLYDESNFTIYRNLQGKGFVKELTDVKMTQSSSGFEIADFNSDGLDDYITFAGHERRMMSGKETTESRPTLLLQMADGTLADFSDNIPEIYGHWHGSEIIDIDHDGDMDIIVSPLNQSLYVLVNDGYANFEIKQDLLPISELVDFYGSETFFILEFVSIDLDFDGVNEIIMGGVNVDTRYSNRIPLTPVLKYNNGRYYLYKFLDLFKSETVSEGQDPEGIYKILPIDIYGYGCPSLVTYNASYQGGYSLNVWENDCKGEISLTYETTYYPTTGGETHSILKVSDLNEDGYPDAYLMKDSVKHFEPLVAILNNGDGTFTKLDNLEDMILDLDTYLYFNGN